MELPGGVKMDEVTAPQVPYTLAFEKSLVKAADNRWVVIAEPAAAWGSLEHVADEVVVDVLA